MARRLIVLHNETISICPIKWNRFSKEFEVDQIKCKVRKSDKQQVIDSKSKKVLSRDANPVTINGKKFVIIKK